MNANAETQLAVYLRSILVRDIPDIFTLVDSSQDIESVCESCAIPNNYSLLFVEYGDAEIISVYGSENHSVAWMHVSLDLLWVNYRRFWPNLEYSADQFLELCRENSDKLMFYVILSVDTCKDCNLYDIVPRDNIIRQNMDITESDDNYDDYGLDYTMRHRKYVGLLTVDQLTDICKHFDSFESYGVYNPGFRFEGDTMGSLTEYGHLPALSIGGLLATESMGTNDTIVNLYVSPMFTKEYIESVDHANCLYNAFETLVKSEFWAD